MTEKQLRRAQKEREKVCKAACRMVKRGRDPKKKMKGDVIPTLSVTDPNAGFMLVDEDGKGAWMDRFLLWIDKNGCPFNSPLAEWYHRRLERTVGMTVRASYAVSVGDRLFIRLWVDEKSARGKVKMPHTRLVEGDPLCDSATRCLREVLGEQGITLPTPKPRKVKNEETGEEENVPGAFVYVHSFDRILWEITMADSVKDINRVFRHRFSFWCAGCIFASFKNEPEVENHIFLFRCQYDIERAERDGILTKMIDAAYEIVQKHDKHGLVSRESYQPVIWSEDQYGVRQLQYD